jgi:phosphatidylglycerophosphatase A
MYLIMMFLVQVPAKLYLGCYILLVFFTFISIVLGDYAERYFRKKDPPAFVLDEIAGFFCSIVFLPPSFTYIFLAFIIFRILDIWKPFPARKLQGLLGGLGIVIDDILAGFYANICCQIIRLLI